MGPAKEPIALWELDADAPTVRARHVTDHNPGYTHRAAYSRRVYTAIRVSISYTRIFCVLSLAIPLLWGCLCLSQATDDFTPQKYPRLFSLEGRGSGCMWGVDAAMADSSTVKECCICGDVGFDHALLHCLSCGFRFQHTYCSGSYPKIDMATWRCEWCIHEESKLKRGNNAFDFLLEIAKSLPDGGGGGEEDEEEDGHPAAANDNNGNNEEKKSQRRRREEEKPQRPKAKRQKSLDRWRRPNCNSSSSPRVIGRRYKLLADFCSGAIHQRVQLRVEKRPSVSRLARRN
ncbi:hypothetical protein ACLOJK_000885 [Asimina triloba]